MAAKVLKCASSGKILKLFITTCYFLGFRELNYIVKIIVKIILLKIVFGCLVRITLKKQPNKMLLG